MHLSIHSETFIKGTSLETRGSVLIQSLSVHMSVSIYTCKMFVSIYTGKMFVSIYTCKMFVSTLLNYIY